MSKPKTSLFCRRWLRVGSWPLVLAVAAAALGNACGSKDSTVAVRPDEGGAAGDNGEATPSGKGGKGSAGGGAANGGTAAVAGTAAGEGGVTEPAAGSGGADTAGAGGVSASGAPGELGGAFAEAGAGGAGSSCQGCVDLAGSLDGLLWKLPCTGAIDDTSCDSDPTVTVTTTLGGTSGVTYDVTLHFRGIVEPKQYTGGCADGTQWLSGGADNGDIGNVYELRISSPLQHFFLNLGDNQLGHPVTLDYTKLIRIDAGATVTLFAASKDAAELRNRDANANGAPPLTIAGTAVPQPFDGQFIEMAVESVVPNAVAVAAHESGTSSGSALKFSGAQLATVADAALLHPTSFTEEAWFQFQGPSGSYNGILGKPNGAGIDDSYTLWFEAGTLRGYASSNTGVSLSEPWTAVQEWHHAALTYDAVAGRQALYVDGTTVACAAATGPLKYDAHNVLIGADIDNGALNGFWNGALDEVRLFGTARSADQIWADLHAHKLGPTAGLVAEWTFDENTGQTAADSSGNALDAVLGSTSDVEASDAAWVAGR